MNNLQGRVVRLEAGRSTFPWHLPIEQWTDAELEHVMRDRPALTDAQLEHLAAGDRPLKETPSYEPCYPPDRAERHRMPAEPELIIIKGGLHTHDPREATIAGERLECGGVM